MAGDVGSQADTANTATPQMVRREMRDFLRAHELRRRQPPRSLLVGLAGLVVVASRGALGAADRIRDAFIAYAHGHFGGFALIAWPAEYGVSGIQTLMINHHGIVYEKDLGTKTDVLARKITRFIYCGD